MTKVTNAELLKRVEELEKKYAPLLDAVIKTQRTADRAEKAAKEADQKATPYYGCGKG
ncbi:MAG: hypothetical protein WC374_06535 [Phycisphaerae bacterium]|jgi:hypothetical protein